jgi:hypothetical protein
MKTSCAPSVSVDIGGGWGCSPQGGAKRRKPRPGHPAGPRLAQRRWQAAIGRSRALTRKGYITPAAPSAAGFLVDSLDCPGLALMTR